MLLFFLKKLLKSFYKNYKQELKMYLSSNAWHNLYDELLPAFIFYVVTLSTVPALVSYFLLRLI